jgi:3-methyladenine DNA glycosylase/8-oxoguanine DNA glycosylase
VIIRRMVVELEGEAGFRPPLSLRRQATLAIDPTPPFAFDATFHKPDHFPSRDTSWEPGVRWQTMRFRGRPLGLRIEDAASCVHVGVWADGGVSEALLGALADELTWRANLRLDLADFERHARRDPQVAPVASRRRGMRPMHLGSLYEYLVIAIVLQNATVRRSVQMLQALFERYGTVLRFDGRQLYAFWDAADMAGTTEQELRALKVGYRAKSLLRISQAIAAGQADETRLRAATVEEQRAALLALFGVGPASVGYILVDVFHAFDEVAHISPWEQRIYSRLLLGVPAEDPAPVPVLLERIACWSPWRALVLHYLWEDLFWRHREEPIDWLRPLIRL